MNLLMQKGVLNFFVRGVKKKKKLFVNVKK
jgi:hypothetical protein